MRFTARRLLALLRSEVRTSPPLLRDSLASSPARSFYTQRSLHSNIQKLATKEKRLVKGEIMEHGKEREAASSHFVSTEEQEKKTQEETNQDIDDQEQAAEQQTENPVQCTCPEGLCICSYLPSLPFATQTTIFLLHHSDETKHSINHLATLSFLSSGLSSLHLILGRRFHPCQVQLLDSLFECPSSSSPVLFLFPTQNAVGLSEWVRLTPAENRTKPVLVVVDGTWNQAWEMANNSLPFLSQFSTCVSFGNEDEMEGGKPSDMTTIVAVARALRILEPQGTNTDALVEALMRVRRATIGRGPMAGSLHKAKKNKGNRPWNWFA